ncbi:hypothetical protein OGATHE_002706 [Ogataea polymorpha]|uniref:Uncharacterized protein n=1 Tax=Ogataea polymorpha TaxID=460523 RepID=A0A9P8PEC0_9ASCO|nr:hypothetical protein OGATHE_002706 [Ogataea polymorpha]
MLEPQSRLRFRADGSLSGIPSVKNHLQILTIMVLKVSMELGVLVLSRDNGSLTITTIQPFTVAEIIFYDEKYGVLNNCQLLQTTNIRAYKSR